MATWSAYVDESGPLYDRARAAALVGFVVQGYPTRQQAERLRARLDAALPGLAWPFHASRARVVAHRVEAALRGAPGASAAAREAGALVVRSADPEARALVAAIEVAREVPWDVLQAADRWLRRASPRLHRQLDDERARADARVDALFAELCRGGQAFVVAAHDPPCDDPDETVRYERVLGGLLERILQLLGGPADVNVVVWSAAFRAAASPGAAAMAALRSATPLRRVTFTTPPAQRWRGSVHPGLVLADLAANRIGREVVPAGSWARAVERARVLPVERVPAFRFGLPALPTLAAEGPPRDAVARAFQGLPPDRSALDVVRPRWAAEQALAWARAVEIP